MTAGLSSKHYEVAVIGYGPVGACLANLLGRLGISTLVLDREGPAYHLPRAVHFDDEIMRVLQTIGIADDMAKLVHVNPGMRFVDKSGKLLLDWPRPPDVSAQGWHPSYRFHQPDLERLLRNALARFPCVDVRTNCEVTHVDTSGNQALLQFTDFATGQTDTARAQYAVGCDGARSFMRETIGSDLEDHGFHERWLVVDVRLKRPMPELGDFSVQYCDTFRPATYVRGTGNRRRWEIAVRPDEVSADLETPDGTWRLLSRWLRPDDAELERSAVYTFHSVIARKWRRGRLFIAGDAAHQTPPFMGQGLCAGIRDAANLAWKLAASVRRNVPDSLLETYQSERHSHVRAYVEASLKLGYLINMNDPGQALATGLAQPDGSSRMSSIAPRIGPGLAAPEERHAGVLAPQLQLASGGRLDDQSGYRFVLIAQWELLQAAGLIPEAIEEAGVHLVVAAAESVATDYLSELMSRAVMIRPDRYVLGTARSSQELRQLFAKVRWLVA